MSTTEDPLRDALLEGIGQPLSAGGPAIAPDPVNVPMIRHWVDAFDDRNPVYLDDVAARAHGFEGIVAPPAMLQTWTMGRPKLEGIAERGGSADEIRGENPITRLADAGYRGTLATNSELGFERYLRPGDRLASEARLESISERKTTALGSGYFVTWLSTYTDERNEVVGRQRFRIYKFAADADGQSPRAARAKSKDRVEAGSGRTPASEASSQANADRGGEVLPPFEIALTSTVIIAGAIASRDFMPVHHDRDYARAQGAPDLFMNILTTNGYVARYVTDWAGPAARLTRIAIRLGAPAIPSQTLRFSGRVVSERDVSGGQEVEVELAATTDLGPHATGHVRLRR